MNEYMDNAFWKENIEDRVKLLGSNVLNCQSSKENKMANFRKRGVVLKWGNDDSKNLAPPRVRPGPSLHYPPLPTPPALPAMNGPLPAELKFKENTVFLHYLQYHKCGLSMLMEYKTSPFVFFPWHSEALVPTHSDHRMRHLSEEHKLIITSEQQ